MSSSPKSPSSYGQILKASAFIGGSSVITLLLGVVRNKVLAVLIGTDGTGLFGAYNSVSLLVGGIAGMGINNSGVRQIAEAAGTGDEEKIARTVITLRRTALILGVLGMLLLLAFSGPIARATFGNADRAGSMALLSVTVLLGAVAAGQVALIQGLRRIADLATLSIWGALLGTVLSLPLVYFFREKGIVPLLITVSALTILPSWWFARKIQVRKVSMSARALWHEARSLLGLGVVFMLSGLMSSAVAYLTRVLVIRQMDLEAAGLYQAAWTVSGVYVSFILNAMGADYYPRLTAASASNEEVNRLVNEQTEISLFMALPGILGTLAFAPWVVHLLYSAEFAPAVEILRWQILGVLGRVIAWPIGFVLLAKGCSRSFFFTELACNVVHLGLIWLGMKQFGLAGLGMAFFGFYLFSSLLVYGVVHRLSGFRWTKSNVQLVLAVLAMTAFVFLVTIPAVPRTLGMVLGGVMTLAAGIYCARRLLKRVSHAKVNEWLNKLRRRSG